MTRSVVLIEFIVGLHGIAWLHQDGDEDRREAAFDVLSGQSIEPADEFPDGDKLVVARFDGQRVLVFSHILIDALILRTAQAWSVTKGGAVEGHYRRLREELRGRGYSYGLLKIGER